MAYSMGQMFLSLDWTVNNVIACPLADVVDSWSCRRMPGRRKRGQEVRDAIETLESVRLLEEWYSTKLEELGFKL